MGMDIGICKYKDIKQNDFDLIYPPIDGEYICYWRKHYWLHNWIKDNCDFKGGHYDEFILSKEKVVMFYDYCLDLVNYGYEKYYNKENLDFYCMLDTDWTDEDVYKEISNVISDMSKLLDDDFNNNIFVYEMSC